MTDHYQNPPASAFLRQGPSPWASLRFYLLAGLMQGIALWALGSGALQSPDDGPNSPWRQAGQYLAFAMPLAWYLGDDAATAWRRRLAVALGIGLLFAGLGAGLGGVQVPQHRLAAAVLGFTLVALSCAAAPDGRSLAYPRLFDYAWRNVLALPLAGFLTGMLWILLTAAAWLMQTIGLDAMLSSIVQPGFLYPVTGAVFGLAIGAVLQRADLLMAVRGFWLALNTWFLPLILAFAVIWLVSLGLTGIAPLFATRQAAMFLFWFCLLAVLFANAAFQDGRSPPALPRGLAIACRWAWLAMPVLALLGDWALWQRVRQYGWTEDRIWAAVAGLVLTLHTLGYAGSVLLRRRGMATLPATNIVVALFNVALLLLLISPIADSRRLAVDSQVRRLLDDRVAIDAFDWALLRDRGPYGPQALERLAALRSAPDARDRSIGQRAARERSAMTRH